MRPDGTLVKHEDPMYYLIPHFLTKRYDAMNMITLDIPEMPMRAYMNEKRKEGKQISHLALVLTAYLHTLEKYPALNRFIKGRKIYQHKDIKVSMYMYDRPAWTGHVYETECFFPTWINKESAPHVQALIDAHHALWGTERIGADEKAMSTRRGRPLTDKWTFSTNGVSIQGRYGIPCVGFGPGAESQAHAPNEVTFKQDLVTCAALYAAVPGLYKPENKDGSATSFRQELTGNDIK